MDNLQLYMVGLIVDDIGASLDFYRRLGLDVPDGPDASHVEIEMAGGMKVFLDSRPERWDPGYSSAPAPGSDDSYRILLEFYLDTEPRVREKYDQLTGDGYRGVRSPYQTQFGMCFAFVEDPDGNTILISGDADTS